MTLYERLEKLSLPFIEYFKEDLTKHDRVAIENNPGVPFFHFTGETGTHIIFLDPLEEYPLPGEKVPYLFGRADRYHILKQKEVMVFAMETSNRQDLILFSDGKLILSEITLNKAKDIIIEYRLKMERQFRAA